MQIRIYEDYLFYILPPCHTFGTPLAENGSEAIIWTNDGKFTDAYMRRSASMS